MKLFKTQLKIHLAHRKMEYLKILQVIAAFTVQNLG